MSQNGTNHKIAVQCVLHIFTIHEIVWSPIHGGIPLESSNYNHMHKEKRNNKHNIFFVFF
jgi:hypothetical protein